MFITDKIFECGGRILSAAETTATSQPADEILQQNQQYPIGLLTVGTLVLMVWIFRRSMDAEPLKLKNAPGRPNTLNAAHIPVLLLVWLIGEYVTRMLLQKWFSLSPGTLIILSGTIAQIIILVSSITVAKRTFRNGLQRGLGFTARRWMSDTVRGVIGYFAVTPVCFAALLLTQAILPEKWVQPHPILKVIAQLPLSMKIVAAASAILLAPLWEEIFFRGLLQSVLRKAASPWVSILISSALFALLHSSSPQNIPALFILSVVLGYNYERTGRLMAPMILHLIFNGAAVLLTLSMQ